MSNIRLDISKAACFLKAGAVEAFEPQVKAAQQVLHLLSSMSCRLVPMCSVRTVKLSL